MTTNERRAAGDDRGVVTASGVRWRPGRGWPGAGAASRLRALTPLVAAAWLLTITGLAIVATRAQWLQFAAVRQSYPWRTSSLTFVLGLVGLAVTLMIGVRLFRPAWWRRGLLALAVLPIPILLISSANSIAGCAVIGLLGPVCWLGREVAARLLRPIDRSDAWIIGGTGGVGTLVALGYALGWAGLLRPQAIWPILLLLTLALLAGARQHLAADIAALSFSARLGAAGG